MANPIVIKKGLEANRGVITPLDGELIYATDTKAVFIGDGVTAGGNPVGASGLTWTTKTAAFTASIGDGVFADTSAGAFSITLPATASIAIGDVLSFVDVAPFSWGTNPLTILQNGVATIDGAAASFVADVSGGSFSLVYSGTDWVVVDFQTAQAAPAAGGGALNLISSHNWSTPVASVDISIPTATYDDFIIVINELGPLSTEDYVTIMGSYDGGVNFELYMMSVTNYFGNNVANTIPMQDDGTFNMSRTVKLGITATADLCSGTISLHNTTASEKAKFIVDLVARDPFNGMPYSSKTVGMFGLHKTINLLRLTTKAGATLNGGRLRLYGVTK